METNMRAMFAPDRAAELPHIPCQRCTSRVFHRLTLRCVRCFPPDDNDHRAILTETPGGFELRCHKNQDDLDFLRELTILTFDRDDPDILSDVDFRPLCQRDDEHAGDENISPDSGDVETT